MGEAVEKLKPCNARAANCHIVCLQAFSIPKSAAQKLFGKQIYQEERKINRKCVPSAVFLSAVPNPSNEMRTPQLCLWSTLPTLSRAVRRVCPDTLE